jgi:hypothetical protein
MADLGIACRCVLSGTWAHAAWPRNSNTGYVSSGRLLIPVHQVIGFDGHLQVHAVAIEQLHVLALVSGVEEGRDP